MLCRNPRRGGFALLVLGLTLPFGGCSSKIQIVKHDGTVIKGKVVHENAGELVVRGKVVREGRFARAIKQTRGPQLSKDSPYVSSSRRREAHQPGTLIVPVDEIQSSRRSVNGAAIGVVAGLVGIVGSALLVSAITNDDEPSYDRDDDRDGAALLFFLCLYAC